MFFPLTLQAETLVPKLSVWKYYADTAYPDLSWNQAGHDDSGWPFGPGILGYGEAYISTTVPYGPDINNKYITTLFRHAFQLNGDPAEITQLKLAANYDDGFVAYLNGTEIARRSLPGGTILHATLALSHEALAYEAMDVSNYIRNLMQGTNVLAVEVHQTTAASTDLVWDAELVASTSQVEFVWSGAVTPTSAVVKAKLVPEGGIARLTVSATPDFSSPIYSNWDTALTAENNRVVRLEVTGLTPSQRYYYAVEVGGALDSTKIGRLQTFPADTGSFAFAFSADALTGSNHPVFETIRSLDPLFFFHLGDFHYQNISVNDPNLYRQAFEAVLASPNQSRLYREFPIAYIWDDHDYGPNDADSTAPGRQAARLTYQEYVPYYPLAAGGGDVPIYYTFDVGRVHFIVCDSRSARSPDGAPDDANKTMLGAAQKAWFKQELLNSKSNHPLIVWVNTLPWIGASGSDAWSAYQTERRELADFLKANGIKNLCMLSGDAHMLAIDDGTNSDYATEGGAAFPVMHSAALDQVGSLKGGPYSHGAFPGRGQFGVMSVADWQDSLRVRWSGRDSVNTEKVGYSFVVCENGVKGDLNTDGRFAPSDAMAHLICVFEDDGPSCDFCLSDVNCSGNITPADAVLELYRVFSNKRLSSWCGL
ncbi:MAG: alkaline phosphatase D family protein [candidate division Zixibacteria bacterium]|nr:alkaline phosphatase D family protein [candidate division Zixibacteria bacterium]